MTYIDTFGVLRRTKCSAKPKRASLPASEKNCPYCHVGLKSANATIDHIHPRARGGGNQKWNLRWCCRACNSVKADLLFDEVKWPCTGRVRRFIEKALASGDGPDAAWDKARAFGMPVGVLVFEKVLAETCRDLGFEPFRVERKDQAMTKALPELFDEVCGKVPAFESGLSHHPGETIGGWHLDGDPITTHRAETIIVGAAVVLLPHHWWGTNADGAIYVCEDHHYIVKSAPTLAEALLLAVIAQAERSGT